MGYAATNDGFYSSGHPSSGSGLINPIGLVKSADGGKTLTTLGFAGESDFHLMGVGYQNHVVYVLNQAQNSKLSVGLHYSLDDGQTWKQGAMRGIPGQPLQIAVHSTNAAVVALASEQGLFLSTDYGSSFVSIGPSEPVSAVAFSPNGNRLFFGLNTLSVYDIASKQSTVLSTLPLAANDAIGFIAANPVRADELAAATFGRNIYRSRDGGRSWQQIAKDGMGRAR
jgi:WD40 repeat protein